MLGMMFNNDSTQDGQLGVDDCFTFVDGSVHHFSAATLQSSVAESASRVSGTSLPTVSEEKENLPSTALRHDKLFSVLTSRWTDKKDQVQATRDEIRKIAQQILLDVLASEWLAGDADTAKVRVYVVDHILPTLIPGIEKLLMEVEKRNLVETEMPDRNFNPINFLAHYIMRNNPRYSNFSEACPYIRGLRSVAEELKQELFHVSEYKYVNWQLMFIKCTIPVMYICSTLLMIFEYFF